MKVMELALWTAMIALGSSYAEADVITYTTTSVLATNSTAYSTPYNYDSANLFGESGANLVGQTATFSFSYDTSAITPPPLIDTGSDYVYFGNTSDPITESVTINGITQTIIGSRVSDLQFGIGSQYVNGKAVHEAQLFVQAADNTIVGGNSDAAMISFVGLGFADQTTGQPILPPGNISNPLYYANFIFADGEQIVSPVDDALLTGSTGGGVSAVPEPSTWAMLLLGFVGLGFAGLRKARTGAKLSTTLCP